MKKLETVILPSQWDEVRVQLETLGVIATLRDVRTFGRSPVRREVYRGSAYVRDTMSEVELSLLVEDDMVEATSGALGCAAIDSEIIVTTVEAVVAVHAQPAQALTVVRGAIVERPIGVTAALSAARV